MRVTRNPERAQSRSTAFPMHRKKTWEATITKHNCTIAITVIQTKKSVSGEPPGYAQQYQLPELFIPTRDITTKFVIMRI